MNTGKKFCLVLMAALMLIVLSVFAAGFITVASAQEGSGWVIAPFHISTHNCLPDGTITVSGRVFTSPSNEPPSNNTPVTLAWDGNTFTAYTDVNGDF